MIADDYTTDCSCEICTGRDNTSAEAFGWWDDDVDQEVVSQ